VLCCLAVTWLMQAFDQSRRLLLSVGGRKGMPAAHSRRLKVEISAKG
jgi:hypothetical protein